MTDSLENAASYFVDRHGAGDRRDKIAFFEADGEKRSLSYGALAWDSGRRQPAMAAAQSACTA